MLIGKTDPFIAVFTKGERSEPWTLVGTTGTRHLPCVAPHARAIRQLWHCMRPAGYGRAFFALAIAGHAHSSLQRR